jgi:L-asparaginase
MNSIRRPKIMVFSLGGTIASTSDHTGSQSVSPQLNATDLVTAVPGLADVGEIVAVTFRQIPSGDLTITDLVALASEIDGEFDSGADGVVVTQGTDTLEETSFILDLLVRDRRPVVVTGAMRNPTLAGPDGPANLLAAARVAASPSAAGLGTLVVLNDEIHAARFVRKTNTSSPSTFRSPSAGPLGWVVEQRPRIVLGVPSLAPIDAVGQNPVPAIALIRLTLGDDERVVNQIVSMGFAGAVVESFGGGHVPSRMVPALESLAAAMPVVLASRTGSGELLRETYGFSGSEQDVLARGLMSAGALDGLKARILLSLIMAVESDRTRIRERFEATAASVMSFAATEGG